MHNSRDRHNVGSVKLGTWIWYFREPPLKEGLLSLRGKYLFFSGDRTRLVKIAMNEIASNGFSYAKVPARGENIGREYVLSLYYKDDSRKFELADKYRGNEYVSYRYWKSDRDTLNGKYSTRFIKDLEAKGEGLTDFQRREGDKK